MFEPSLVLLSMAETSQRGGSFGIGELTAALARQDELELELMASQLGHDEAILRLGLMTR